MNKENIRVWALVFKHMEALEALQPSYYKTMKEEARLASERQENKGKGKGKDRNKGREKGSDKGKGKGKQQQEKGGGYWAPAHQGNWGWGKDNSWGGNQDRWGKGQQQPQLRQWDREARDWRREWPVPREVRGRGPTEVRLTNLPHSPND